jgi:pimeloyl-ACP methyl ester carboxylesterase
MKNLTFRRQEGTLALTDYGGEGDLVLMFPGMGALRSEYRYLGPKLAEEGFHAVSVDLRGHGDSSVPWHSYDVPSVGCDVLALVDHLKASSAHMIGTSFAASAVVWAAAEEPSRAASVVLISPFVRDAKISFAMKALFWLMMNNPWRVRLWGRYYSTLYPTSRPPDFKEYLKELTENLAEPGRMDAANALANSSRLSSDERLDRVKAPSLVIMGTKDPDFLDPVAEGSIVADRMGGTLTTVEGAGHYPQSEMPDKTAAIVTGFLNQHAEKDESMGAAMLAVPGSAPGHSGLLS